MYAISQGALGVECRDHDVYIQDMLHNLIDFETLISCIAERAFLKKMVSIQFFPGYKILRIVGKVVGWCVVVLGGGGGVWSGESERTKIMIACYC